FLLGLEHPVRAWIADSEQVAHRDVEPDPVVAPARLEHQHARFRIGRQPVGHDAARRAGTDDDVVEVAFETRHGHSANLLMSPSQAHHGTSWLFQIWISGRTPGSSSRVATRRMTCGSAGRSASTWLPHTEQKRRSLPGED